MPEEIFFSPEGEGIPNVPNPTESSVSLKSAEMSVLDLKDDLRKQIEEGFVHAFIRAKTDFKMSREGGITSQEDKKYRFSSVGKQTSIPGIIDGSFRNYENVSGEQVVISIIDNDGVREKLEGFDSTLNQIGDRSIVKISIPQKDGEFASAYLVVPPDTAKKFEQVAGLQGFTAEHAIKLVEDVFLQGEAREKFHNETFDTTVSKLVVKTASGTREVDSPAQTDLPTQEEIEEPTMEEIVGAVPEVTEKPPASSEDGFGFDDEEFDFGEGDDGLDFDDDFDFDEEWDLEDKEDGSSDPPEPPQPPTGETENSPEEYNFSDWSFSDLDANIRHIETTGEELEASVQEREKRATAENNAGFLSRLKADARSLLLKGDNSASTRNEITKIANDIEKEIEDDPNYRIKDKGIIRAAGAGLRDWLIALDARMNGRADAEILERKAERTHFLRVVVTEDEIGSDVSAVHTPAGNGTLANGSLEQAREIGRAMSEAFMEGQLTSDEAYQQFLKDERRNEAPLDHISERGAPMYWRRLAALEQLMNNSRRELNNAAFIKRTQVQNLETYAKNPELGKIQRLEQRRLYESMPGYKEVLEEWVDIFFNKNEDRNKIDREYVRENTDGTTQVLSKRVSVIECADEDEAEKFRNLVDARVAPVVRAKIETILRRQLNLALAEEDLTEDQKEQLIQEELDRKAKRLTTEAGQAGFNALFALGAFEAWSIQWDGDRWEKVPELHEGRLVNDGVREQMHPLNTLISKAHAGEKWGALGEYAVEMLRRISPNDYDAIQIIHPRTFEEAQQFWTVNGRTLFVPECYPKKSIGSAIDETKIHGKSMTEYLRNRESIPWNRSIPEDFVDSVDSSELGSKYGRTLNHTNNFLTFSMSVVPLRPGVQEERWEARLDKAKVKVSHLNTSERRKWIVLVQKGLHPYSNVPLMQGNGDSREATRKLYSDPNFFPIVFPGEDAFFGWDGVKRSRKVEGYLKAKRQAYNERHNIKEDNLIDRLLKS